MNKRLLAMAIAGVFAAPLAGQAGTVTTLTLPDITLSGGITGAYLNTSEGPSPQDAFVVNDALIDLKADAKDGVGFDLGIGSLSSSTLASRGELNDASTNSVAVQYGFVTLKPMDGLSLDVGKLITNIGYEVVPSYANANILHGLVFNRQPAYYNGARATYSVNGINVYAEANKNATGTGNPGWAVGANGTFGSVNAAVNFLDVIDQGTLIDVIASSTMGSTTVGINVDFINKADAIKTSGSDDNAYGVALYATMPLTDKFTLPVRLEYVNDGTSGIYNLDGNPDPQLLGGLDNSAWTLTVTPTYNFNNHMFVRGEVAYVMADKDGAYVDDDGAADDNAWTVGVQAGVRF